MNCTCCNYLSAYVFSHKYSLPYGPRKEPFIANYHSCSNCRHIFYSSELHKEDYDAYYAARPLASLGNDLSEAYRYELERFVARIVEFVTSSRNLDWSTVSCLEIGAGNGAFLDEMKKLGTKTFFYDLSIDVTERLSKHHSKCNQNSKYDFLILRHVLEHTANPFEFLSYIKNKFCHSKTFFYLEIPDWNFMDTFNENFFSEHIQHFNTLSLHRILRRVGLSPEFIFSSRNSDYNFGSRGNIRNNTTTWKLSCIASMDNCNDFTDDSNHIYDIKKYHDDYYHSRYKIINNLISTNQRIAIHGASHCFAGYVINEASEEILKMIVLFDGNKTRYGEEFNGFTINQVLENNIQEFDNMIIFAPDFAEDITRVWRENGFKGNIHNVFGNIDK